MGFEPALLAMEHGSSVSPSGCFCSQTGTLSLYLWHGVQGSHWEELLTCTISVQQGEDIEVEEELIDYGSEEEAALEDAAADAAVDAGLVVLDDYVFNSDDVGRSLTGLKAKTKKFLDRVVRLCLCC